MSLYEIFLGPDGHKYMDWALKGLIIISTIVQIAPIQINPWSALMDWIGKSANKSLRKDVDQLRHAVVDLWVSEHRRRILTFARECRRGVDHSMEEWRFVIANMEEYENYCRRNKIDNGVIKEDSAYVRELYHELLRQHKL